MLGLVREDDCAASLVQAGNGWLARTAHQGHCAGRRKNTTVAKTGCSRGARIRGVPGTRSSSSRETHSHPHTHLGKGTQLSTGESAAMVSVCPAHLCAGWCAGRLGVGVPHALRAYGKQRERVANNSPPTSRSKPKKAAKGKKKEGSAKGKKKDAEEGGAPAPDGTEGMSPEEVSSIAVLLGLLLPRTYTRTCTYAHTHACTRTLAQMHTFTHTFTHNHAHSFT